MSIHSIKRRRKTIRNPIPILNMKDLKLHKQLEEVCEEDENFNTFMIKDEISHSKNVSDSHKATSENIVKFLTSLLIHSVLQQMTIGQFQCIQMKI